MSTVAENSPQPGKLRLWLKRLGWAGFLFFLLKGLILYILLPWLAVKGFWGK